MYLSPRAGGRVMCDGLIAPVSLATRPAGPLPDTAPDATESRRPTANLSRS